MNFPALAEAEQKLAAKQKELAAIFTEAGPDLDMSNVKSLGDSVDVVDHIRNLNTELDELGRDVEAKRAVKTAAERAANFADHDQPGHETGVGSPVNGPQAKSLGKLFVESAAYKGRTGSVGPEAHIDVEFKTLMSTTAGWAPETTRSGLLVLEQTRPIQVTDLIPVVPTSQSAYVYMEETTFTNNAAEAAEGGTYGEAALALTEQSSTVRKIAVWLPVTDEQLEDEPAAEGYINTRLPFMLRQRLDSQILTGNGTAPNLRGVNNVAGIQTQAKGTDPTPDAVHKAITKVRVTGRAMPNAVIFHPNDWQDIRLLRTADGVYIWGNPSDSGVERIWGLPVVQSDAQTENTAVVGDFANYSLLAVRRGIDVQVTNSHSTFFIEGKQAIRADMRAALVFTRAEAFCTVTGI